jgi:hypothetical protein
LRYEAVVSAGSFRSRWFLRRYLEVAPGGRAHCPIDQDASLDSFEQIAEQYRVFRIER